MVSYMAFVSARARPGSEATSLTAADTQGVDEILKAFSMLFTAFPEHARKYGALWLGIVSLTCRMLHLGVEALGIILPVLILLLDPNQSPPTSLHSIVMSQVLAYATAHSLVFKEVTGKLGTQERDILEKSVRRAVDVPVGAPGAPAVKRQISLRTF
jgi:hypothetical protein